MVIKLKSLTELYRIGRGPSSSHTMGPESAVNLFKSQYPDADQFRAVLFGSLALTGKGHGTDRIIKETFLKPVAIEFDTETVKLPHPNTMDLYAYRNGDIIGYRRFVSVGGGEIKTVADDGMTIEDENQSESPEIYHENSFDEIKKYCTEHDIDIADYVFEKESSCGIDIEEFLSNVWQTMINTISEGLQAEGELPGGLHLQRKARHLYKSNHIDESPETRENRLVCAYAYAVSEQNASGGKIVTAPTCGSCGVVPAVMKYVQKRRDFSDEQIIRALAVGGIIGNLIKSRASISGAQCGCQAEIGSACSMAAASLASLYGMDINQIEYAAEIAMEHHLGLTCDPIYGLVQIPCIERNAVAAMRAINAVSLANFLTDTRKISFDLVIATMYETGRDLSKRYRETSEGGLAKLYTPPERTSDNRNDF